MTDWTIRKATQKDAEALATCVNRAYSAHAQKGIDLPPVSEGIEDDIRTSLVWVAVLGQDIIGGLILTPRKDRAILKNVAVDPSLTGRGIGRELMDRAEHETRNLGFDRMGLTTHVDMPENVRMYERLGWQETGRVGNKVHMEKALHPLA